jgi:hypothetical protein
MVPVWENSSACDMGGAKAMTMLIQLIVVLVVLGLVLYLCEQYIPMSPPIRTVLRVVVVLLLCLWLLSLAGIITSPALLR